jgi:hypothetical protein
MADQPRDYTPYQQKIIRRYYENQPTLLRQRLAELVSELYLAEGKKRDRLWKQVGEMLPKLGLGAVRVQHLLTQRKPELIAELVKELEKS